MRDPGLQEAIRVAGGVSGLARRLGITQPSVSNWQRVPAERVLDVEAATGIRRSMLRPDLYAAEKPSPPGSDETAAASGLAKLRGMRIVGLAGWSGAGKTTLLARVIPILVARGVRVSTIKHAHHGFDVDVPGKDSHTHRMAGATEVFVSSARRWAHIHESRDEREPSFGEILARLTPVDLVVSEGYKRHPHPKLEIYRAGVGKPLLHPDDDWIVAVASDAPVPDARVPVIDLADAEKIADVLMVESAPVERLSAEALEA